MKFNEYYFNKKKNDRVYDDRRLRVYDGEKVNEKKRAASTF